ncbi:hypothetical protein PMG11_00950 [Penicillium brasilianum]|uniref:Transcription factor domain-containing protein n=1 Tax=Penicillium brasilianum TaxID=104259 RepID=A0A0F7TD29_PENBI|nr:hypothetical protein PMG11_00950 [Penicillium brasilianum]
MRFNFLLISQLPTGRSSCNSNNNSWSPQVIAAEDAGSASSINGKVYEIPASPEPPQPGQVRGDAISRGTISSEVGSHILSGLMGRLNPFSPTVSLAEEVSLSYMRRYKPFLLSAIFAVASGTIVPQLQSELALTFTRDIASHVMFYMEKSVDLIQAMLVYATWHMRHRECRDSGFGVYIRLAALMAINIGLSDPGKIMLEGALEEQAEMRRTWLSCYHTALLSVCHSLAAGLQRRAHAPSSAAWYAWRSYGKRAYGFQHG